MEHLDIADLKKLLHKGKIKLAQFVDLANQSRHDGKRRADAAIAAAEAEGVVMTGGAKVCKQTNMKSIAPAHTNKRTARTARTPSRS